MRVPEWRSANGPRFIWPNFLHPLAMARSVQRLRAGTAWDVISTLRLPSWEHIILELIWRAISAGADRIALILDIQHRYIACTDNARQHLSPPQPNTLVPTRQSIYTASLLTCLAWVGSVVVQVSLPQSTNTRAWVQSGYRLHTFVPRSHVHGTKVQLYDIFGHVRCPTTDTVSCAL